MPKETFFNLPADKREHITSIAVNEFANHDYANVSISRIVARAGIAKGSFYQYFDDKEDLFDYLIDLLAEKKREMFSLDHPDPQQIGIFRYLHWMVQAAVQFELAYPELVRVGWRAARNGSLPAIQARYRVETMQFYTRLIAKGKAEGDIDPELDDELVAYYFNSVFTSMAQFLLPRIIEHQQNHEIGRVLWEKPEVARIFDQAIDILEAGVGASRRASNAQPRPVPEALQEVGSA